MKLPARAESPSRRTAKDDAGRNLVPDAMRVGRRQNSVALAPRMSASTPSPAVLHLALELSVTSWLIAYRLPWSDKVRLQRVSAGDSAALLTLVSDLREKVAARMGPDLTLASCFEAGREGFWLHRLLTDNRVINHVVEPTSILVTRGSRRAKTDRLDAQGLLRVLAAAFAGDRGIAAWSGRRASRRRTTNDLIASANISFRSGSASRTGSPLCLRPRASQETVAANLG